MNRGFFCFGPIRALFGAEKSIWEIRVPPPHHHQIPPNSELAASVAPAQISRTILKSIFRPLIVLWRLWKKIRGSLSFVRGFTFFSWKIKIFCISRVMASWIWVAGFGPLMDTRAKFTYNHVQQFRILGIRALFFIFFSKFHLFFSKCRTFIFFCPKLTFFFAICVSGLQNWFLAILIFFPPS